MQLENCTPVNFSEHLALLLRQRGLTQKRLAQEVSVSEPTVVKWLKGSTPFADALNRLASFFGLHPDFLLSPAPYKLVFEEAAREAELIADPVERSRVYNELVRQKTRSLMERQKGYQATDTLMREDAAAYGSEDWKARALRAEASLEELRMQISKLSAAAKPAPPPAVDPQRKTVEYPKPKRTKKS